jgi:hypothetical protein
MGDLQMVLCEDLSTEETTIGTTTVHGNFGKLEAWARVAVFGFGRAA